jgi:hypothetical protein
MYRARRDGREQSRLCKEKNSMCMSCGCGEPNDPHGDKRNITAEDVNKAAEAAGISPQQAAQNIADAAQQQMGGRGGMGGMGGGMGRERGGMGEQRGMGGMGGYQSKSQGDMGRRDYGTSDTDM